MIECLKEQKKQLSQRCHQRIFRLQEVEMSDPELDYQLMRVCKQMIKVSKQLLIKDGRSLQHLSSDLPVIFSGSAPKPTPGTSSSV